MLITRYVYTVIWDQEDQSDGKEQPSHGELFLSWDLLIDGLLSSLKDELPGLFCPAFADGLALLQCGVVMSTVRDVVLSSLQYLFLIGSGDSRSVK